MLPDPRRVLKDNIERVAHVGFVVPDLAEAVAEAQRVYGLSASEIQYVPEPGVASPTRFAFFTVGGLEFELIEPVSDDFRDKLLTMPSGGAGINHVAWRVKDIDEAVACLAVEGIFPGHVTPDGVVRIGEKKMVYLDPDTTGGLVIELIEYLADA
jgi:catechol 2,3-dioxygenase-like lactoylglutathione lyase family enzyme